MSEIDRKNDEGMSAHLEVDIWATDFQKEVSAWYAEVNQGQMH